MAGGIVILVAIFAAMILAAYLLAYSIAKTVEDSPYRDTYLDMLLREIEAAGGNSRGGGAINANGLVTDDVRTRHGSEL